MTDQNTKKDNNNQGGVNPAVAAGVGAVVGAGVAVAATMALKDEKSRQKVTDVINHVKDHAAGYIDDLQKQAEDKKSEVEDQLEEGNDKVKKVASAAK